jgi:rhamnosyl/mannosyltransferase
LKIVHASKFYPPVPGGIETIVKELCDHTADDWDVRVIAANTSGTTVTERQGGVTVTRAACLGRAHSVPLCPSLPFHLWRAHADCVVLHEPNPIAGTALFTRLPAPRLIVWHHSDLLRPQWAPATYGRVQQALYRRAACVVVSSPILAAASPLVKQARRVAIVPFGIRVDRFRQLDDRQLRLAEAIRRRYASPRVLFVGRLVYYKGLDVLIDALGDVPGTLILAGEGPLDHELRERAAARGVLGRVHFLGRIADDDLPAYYHGADLFALPSTARTETFGVVQVEAMAAGLPVISTDLPTGVPWVNQDGVSGIVVPPGDASALAAALTRLAGDAALRAALGRNASARAESVFGLATMIERFRAVVEDAVRTPAWARDAGPVRAGAQWQ